MQGRGAQIIVALFCVAVAILALAAVSSAAVVVDSFGLPGPQGGRLNEISGMAIDRTGAGGVPAGTLYVGDVNEGNAVAVGKDANRIQRFDPEGGFERLWGLDVVGPNEIQKVTIGFGAKGDELTVGGEFSLEFEGDARVFKLAHSGAEITPSTSELQSGLEDLPSIGPGNVRVRGGLSTTTSGGSYEIEFTGAKGGTNLEQIAIDGSAIQASPPVTTSVETLQNGFGGNEGGFEFEICKVAAECKFGSTATPAPGGQVHEPAGIAVDQTTGDVYVADSGDNRIEEFDADGHFLRAWGWDVVKSGGAGDVSENAFEVCTVAADCKTGASSESGGAVGFAHLDIDPAGNLWVAEADNRRFQEFEPDGSFVAAYGWHVNASGSEELEKCTSTAPGACQAGTKGSGTGQFESGPSSFTIDSAGFVYAIDRGANRIWKFAPDMSSATQFALGLLGEAGLSSLERSVIVARPGGGFVLSGRSSDGFRIFELDAAGAVLKESLAGDGLPRVSALAVTGSTGPVYASVVNSSGGPGVAIVDESPVQAPPVLTIPPVTGIGAEEATFNATVDPGGLLVANCRFEYSTDQVAWKEVPVPGCESLDREGGPQPLSKTVEGLEPGTHYFVRFKAGRYYYAAGGAETTEAEFTTISLPPLLSDVGAALPTDRSAYLAGEIKPRSQSFEYHFEYGTSEALGTSTPTVQGTGAQQRVVAHLLEGLAPQTHYYLKLVATNAVGTTESPVVSFITRPSLPIPTCKNEGLRKEQEEQDSVFLPDCRAYEQVTPPEKNFANPEGGFPAADGEAALVTAGGGFGDPAGQIGEIATAYRSVRTPEGWRTRWTNESYCSKDLEETHFQPVIGGNPVGYSENLDFLAIVRPEASVCPYPPLDPTAPTPQSNLYRADFHEVAEEGPVNYDLLAPAFGAAEPSLKGTGGRYAGSSDDWSHVVYTSNGNQTEPPDSPAAGEFAKVYDWHEGTLTLVSKSTANAPLATSSGVPEDALHGVSAEGNRIFFMNPTSSGGDCTPATCEIYMRQNGTKTFDVSESECTSSCGSSAPDEFLDATADGSKVLFKSAAKLVNEDTAAGSDLYLYTHGTSPKAEPDNLALLSKDLEPADGSSAAVLGVLGMSEDAGIVYFAAQGQLVSGKPTTAGTKLYRWAANEGSPTLTYLTTLANGSADAGNWSGSGPNGTRSAVQEVTPDGKYLLVRTAVRIDPGADHDKDADLYRWSSEDGWLCISCQAPTTPSLGNVELTVNGASGHYQHAMSEDGGEVFFSTPDALLPADVNQKHRRDVYEWREDGSLALISSGTDEARDIAFLGAGASGRDVFFITYKPLVGWDTDNGADVYDAREGGGFAEPPPPPPICNPDGGACMGAPTSEPPAPQPATPAIEAPPGHSPKKPRKKCGQTGKAKSHSRRAKQSRKKPSCHRANKGSRR